MLFKLFKLNPKKESLFTYTPVVVGIICNRRLYLSEESRTVWSKYKVTIFDQNYQISLPQKWFMEKSVFHWGTSHKI